MKLTKTKAQRLVKDIISKHEGLLVEDIESVEDRELIVDLVRMAMRLSMNSHISWLRISNKTLRGTGVRTSNKRRTYKEPQVVPMGRLWKSIYTEDAIKRVEQYIA